MSLTVEQLRRGAGIREFQLQKRLIPFIPIRILLFDGKLSLPGFGSLVVEECKERKGHNPRTGESITIPAGKVVKFRAGINLKKQIQ